MTISSNEEDETHETFTVEKISALSTAGRPVLLKAVAVGEILNDDFCPRGLRLLHAGASFRGPGLGRYGGAACLFSLSISTPVLHFVATPVRMGLCSVPAS